MSACNFSIPFSGSPADVLNQAQTAIHEYGGHFSGDERSGFFKLGVLGSDIAGTYSVSGQTLNITIESKPFMIPCGTIESYLTKYVEAVRV